MPTKRILQSSVSPVVRNHAPLPQPGDTIAGKYAVVRELGEGGMGVVYEAMHLRLRQRLAIKVLRPDVSDVQEVLARFEREGRATAQLRSIHAARVIDVDTLPNGPPYIVMEFLDGLDLEAELKTVGAVPVEEAVDIVLQVAAAMAEAHALGIVHRDLKPSNLFVCRVGDRRLVKVLDFGISKIEGDPRITASDQYFGTPCYAAPEQLRAASAADARSDVWSLGVILFELLTGRTPFEGNATAVIVKVTADPVPSPSEIRPDLPRDLVRVVMRALQRDPQERFQSVGELADALEPMGPPQSAAAFVANTQRERGRLGEILVSDGLIRSSDLERALLEQRASGKLLGRVLLDMGLVARADLLAALAKQQGIAATSLPPSAMNRERTKRSMVTLRSSASVSPRARLTLHGKRIALAICLLLGVVGAIGVRVAKRRPSLPAVMASGHVTDAPSGGASVPVVAVAPAPAAASNQAAALSARPGASPISGPKAARRGLHAAPPPASTTFDPDAL
jgi:serine/threonine-protein kinase